MSSPANDSRPTVPDLSRVRALESYLESARRRVTLEEAPF